MEGLERGRVGVPEYFLGCCGSAAPCNRKKRTQIATSLGDMFFSVFKILLSTIGPQLFQQLWYSNVLIELFQFEICFFQRTKRSVDKFLIALQFV